MAETQPQQRLIIYDQEGKIVWDGLVTNTFPALEPGKAFWTGGFAPPQKRDWYTVVQSMTGLETQTGQLVTELVVSRSKEVGVDSPPSRERGDQQRTLRVIEDVEEFTVKKNKVSWRNKAKTIKIDFIPDYPARAECFIESRQGPVHRRHKFGDIGGRADIPLDKGKLTILMTALNGYERIFCFRIIEFGEEA